MDDRDKFASLRANNSRLTGTGTNCVFEDINVYATVRPSPPPPLPGVFVVDPPKRQIISQVKSNLNSSTKTLHTSYTHHHNKIGNFSGAVTSPSLNQFRFNNHTTIYPNQSEFQPSSLDMFDYPLDSDEKDFNRLQPILQSPDESLLPAEESIYHTLQPVPHTVFDMPPSSEAKVYQQLQPVLHNDFEFSMKKSEMTLGKSYQQSGLPIVSLSHKEHMNTYQEISSSGLPTSLIRDTKSAQQLPTASSYNPPHYANSKLYQQLRQPLHKTAKMNYHPSGRTFSNVGPVTVSSFEKTGHPHCNQLGQQTLEIDNKMFTTQHNTNTFTQLQRSDNSTHFQDVQDLIDPRVSLSNNISNTHNSKPQPNLQNKYSPISHDKGFQSNKPKVYLELRRPSIREQVQVTQLNCQTSAIDTPFMNSNPGYKRSQESNHPPPLMQGQLPFEKNENKHKLVRLPGPYEFNLSQNTSEVNKLPKILCPEEYTTSPERNQQSSFNMNMESLVLSTTLQSPLKSVPSKFTSSPVKQNKTPLSLPKAPVCYGDFNVIAGSEYQNTSLDYNNLSGIPSFSEMLPSTNTSCSKNESRFSSKPNNVPPSVPKLQESLAATNLVHKRTLSATKEQQNKKQKTNEFKSKSETCGLNQTHTQITYSPTTVQNSFSQNHRNSSLEQLRNTVRNNCISNKKNQTLNTKQTASFTEVQNMPCQNHNNNFVESLGRSVDKHIVDSFPQDSCPIKKSYGNNQKLNELQNSFSVDIGKNVSQNENRLNPNNKDLSDKVCKTDGKSKVINQISEENPNYSTTYDQRKNFQNNIKSPQEIKNKITFDDCETDENYFNKALLERSIYSHNNVDESSISQNSKISEEKADKTGHNHFRSIINSDQSFHETQNKTSECSPKHVKTCTSPLEINSENKIVNIITTIDSSNRKHHANANSPLNNPLCCTPSNDESSKIIEDTANGTINKEKNNIQITEGLVRILQEKSKHLSRIQNCNNTAPPTGNVEDSIFSEKSPEQIKESINGKHFTNFDNNSHLNIAPDSSIKTEILNDESDYVVKIPENVIQSHVYKQDSIYNSSPFEQLKANSEALSCDENEASSLQHSNIPESFNDNPFPESNALLTNSVTNNTNPASTTFSLSPTNSVSTPSSENLVRKYKKRKYVTNSPKSYNSCELPIEHKIDHSLSRKERLPNVPKVLISLKENIASSLFNVTEKNLGKRSVKKVDYKILNGGDDDEEDEIVIKKRKYHKSAKSMNHYKVKKIKSTGLLTPSVESLSSKSSADVENGISVKPQEFEPPATEPSILEDEKTGKLKKRRYTRRAVTTKKNVTDMECDNQEYSSPKCKDMKEGDSFNNNAECSNYLQTSIVKQEFIDPLQEGLISEDEDEVVFLGFDMPPEEDETILGFDFSPAKEDMDPVNFLCEQLEADFVTVECDPRFLLQSTPTPCPQCAMIFSTHQDLVDHIHLHSATPSSHSHAFSCDFCYQGFSSKGKLDKHIKWNHKGGKQFSCPICYKRFTTKPYVKKHVETIHKKKTPNPRFYCADCVNHFPSEKLLKKHEDQVHKIQLHQCNKCLKYFEKLSNLQKHELSHTEVAETFPCAYCSKQFSSKELLHAHWRVHNKKRFKCEICDREFTASTSLKRHKLLHAKEKLFRCEICQRSFNYLSTLKTHLLIHTGARRFECRLCHKTFNRRDVLNSHQWTHTGEKKFQCDICNEKFRWRHAVKSHKLIYHSTEKPFVCQTCGKKFSHPDSFKKHAQVHSERLHYCQICLKSFSRLNTLKIHLITHTDHKPFFCDVCKRGFRSKSHLRGHFLTHTKEKPWLCKFCNKTYKDCNRLRRHKRVVHCKAFYKKFSPGVPENIKTVKNIEINAGTEKFENEGKEVLNKTDNSEKSNSSE